MNHNLRLGTNYCSSNNLVRIRSLFPFQLPFPFVIKWLSRIIFFSQKRRLRDRRVYFFASTYTLREVIFYRMEGEVIIGYNARKEMEAILSWYMSWKEQERTVFLQTLKGLVTPQIDDLLGSFNSCKIQT